MTVRVGINGFGRVGRSFLRIARGRDVEVVAINDLTDTATLAHLLAFDSTFGRLDVEVTAEDGAIVVDGHADRRDRRAGSRPCWTGPGTTSTSSSSRPDGSAPATTLPLHLKSGARKVLISAPGKNADVTIVLGVNDGDYDPLRHDVVSNASCTTNCVAPMGKVLSDAFGIETGLMTTIHAFTNDQVTLDSPAQGPPPGPDGLDQHHPDIDRGRPGRRPGRARPGRPPRRAGRAGPRRGRVADRPHRPARARGDGRGGQRRVPGGLRRRSCGLSSATARSLSCPATSSATRRRASSTPA